MIFGRAHGGGAFDAFYDTGGTFPLKRFSERRGSLTKNHRNANLVSIKKVSCILESWDY